MDAVGVQGRGISPRQGEGIREGSSVEVSSDLCVVDKEGERVGRDGGRCVQMLRDKRLWPQRSVNDSL